MEGELENRSGVKEEGFKGDSVRLLTGSMKLNLGLLSHPLRQNVRPLSQREKVYRLTEVTNWPVEAKCLAIILSSYIFEIREYTSQFSGYMSSIPITVFPHQHSLSC